MSGWYTESQPICTGGLGAIAFTFDHGLTAFKAKRLPQALAQRGFGYGLALNDSTLSLPENAGATDKDVLSWAGAEIWNHGYSHSSAKTEDEVHTVVVHGKEALEDRFGREVWGFIPAGVGRIGLAGFDGGSSKEMWETTLAGRLITEHHAVTTGYLGTGGIRPLTGTIQQGLSRFTMDSLRPQRIKQQIDLAISEKIGVMFMLHPSRMGRANFISATEVISVFNYAQAKQDSGEIMVLAPGELVRADSRIHGRT